MDWEGMSVTPDDMQDVEDFSQAVMKKLSPTEASDITADMLQLTTELAELGDLFSRRIGTLPLCDMTIALHWAILIKIYHAVKKNRKALMKLTNIKLESEPFDTFEI